MTGQMTLTDIGIVPKSWLYYEDNATLMCRCPECEGRMVIYLWTYWNPYKYCPYCGIRLQEGNFVKRYCRIYESDEETVLKVRRECKHEDNYRRL